MFTWPIQSGRRGRTFWQSCPRLTQRSWTLFFGGSRPSPLTSFWSDWSPLAIQMMPNARRFQAWSASSRNNRFAGFLLGHGQGSVAIFMTAGLQALQVYANELVPDAPWVQQQTAQLVRKAW